MNPPHTAARLARLKKTLMRKHCAMVAMVKASMKTKITDGSEYSRTLPDCVKEECFGDEETHTWLKHVFPHMHSRTQMHAHTHTQTHTTHIYAHAQTTLPDCMKEEMSRK